MAMKKNQQKGLEARLEVFLGAISDTSRVSLISCSGGGGTPIRVTGDKGQQKNSPDHVGGKQLGGILPQLYFVRGETKRPFYYSFGAITSCNGGGYDSTRSRRKEKGQLITARSRDK